MKDDVVSRTPPQAQPPQTAPLPDLPPAGALTASRLSLAEKCPLAFALPHAATESGPSTRGTLVHAYIEHVLSTGEADPSRIKDPEARELCERLDPVELYRVARGKPTFGTTGRPEEPVAEADGSVEEELFTELPLALDPESGQARTLPSTSGGHRDYSEAPHGWVCGTADAVAVFGGGRHAPYYGQDELSGPPAPPGKVVVTDWKTGAIAVEHPEANLQLRFLALAAARAFGEAGAAVEQAVVQLAYIDGSGGISVSAFEFDADDLAGIHEQIRAIARRVDEARTKPVAAPAADLAEHLAEQQQDATGLPGAPRLKGLKVGAHCRYCPALRFCPAQASAARALLEYVPGTPDGRGEGEGEGQQAVLARKAAQLAPAEAALIWERLQAVKQAIKVSEEALAAYVEHHDGRVELPGGGELRLVSSRREKIVPELTMPLLRELYGEEADRAVSITKKGLSAVAGAYSKKLLEEIAHRGGVQTTYSERLQEVGRRRSSSQSSSQASTK